MVFMIWEIVMGFTNQIFKWIGDVSNDLGEAKANQAFVGAVGTGKQSVGQVAQANAMKASIDDEDRSGKKTKKADPTQAMQADSRTGNG